MSGVGKALAAIFVVTVAVAVWAVWYAIAERADNKAGCEAAGTRYVSTGHGNHLCIAPDGRVVAP